MATPEKRITLCFKLRTPLSFHRMETLSGSAHQGKAINISTSGVYFATNSTVCVGETVEVLLEMPKRIAWVKVSVRRFAGRVTNMAWENLPRGASEIGEQSLYYARDLVKIRGRLNCDFVPT